MSNFNNGVATFTPVSSVLCAFYVSTDAQGHITQCAAPPTDGSMTFFDFYYSDWLFGTND